MMIRQLAACHPFKRKRGHSDAVTGPPSPPCAPDLLLGASRICILIVITGILTTAPQCWKSEIARVQSVGGSWRDASGARAYSSWASVGGRCGVSRHSPLACRRPAHRQIYSPSAETS